MENVKKFQNFFTHFSIYPCRKNFLQQIFHKFTFDFWRLKIYQKLLKKLFEEGHEENQKSKKSHIS